MTAAFSPRPGAYDLHFRQHYALSTSDDPGNPNWKQRSSCGFPGKIMVYSRQGYALNHNDDDVRHDDDRNERTTTPTCVSCPPLPASFPSVGCLLWGACWPLWMPDCDT